MKKNIFNIVSVFIFSFIFLAGFVSFAEFTQAEEQKIGMPPCEFSENLFSKVNGVSIENEAMAKRLLGSNSEIKLVVTDTQKEYYFKITENIAEYKGTTVLEDLKFIVTTDSCTLQRLDQGGDLLKEYDDDKINVKGVTVGKKTKMFFGKIGYAIYGWFN